MSNPKDRQPVVSAVLVMLCTLLSRLLGFARIAYIGALFGVGGVADVITLVFNIPNNLRKLLAEGALSTAFIPEISRELKNDPTQQAAYRLTRSIMGLQIVILLPLVLLSLFFPEPVLVFFENFSNPEKSALSVILFRWMIPYVLLVSFSALMMAVHNVHGRFFIPALSPLVFSISVIVVLAISHRQLGYRAMGVGVLVGGIAQIVIQFPSYKRMGYKLLPSFDFHISSFKRMVKRWIPILLTSSLFVINQQVAMLLASILPDKSPSALFFAVVLFQLPFGIFSGSINTVLYPKMSRQITTDDQKGFLESLGFGYRNIWALLFPSALFLILLGEPLVALAFQRQAFTRNDTQLIAGVLLAYSVGMPFVGIFNLSQRAFYAMGALRRALYSTLFTVGLDILLSLFFVFVFHWPIASLAWANTIAFFLGSIVQYYMLHAHLNFSIRGFTTLACLRVILVTMLAMGLVFSSRFLIGTHWWEGGSTWKTLGIMLGLSIFYGGIILFLYVWIKVEIVSIIFRKKGQKKNAGEENR